jgi:hypothetical protein
MNAAELATVLASLAVGDVVTVTAGGKDRSVRVTEIVNGYVYTASGAVRPGHRAGGVIRIAPWGMTFQPTLQQPTREVTALARHAVLAFPKAA